MRAVVDPGPTRLDEFTGRDHSGVAKDGDQVALAAGFDTQHAKAVLGVAEGHPVDQARQDLSHFTHRCLRHRRMMDVGSRRFYLVERPYACRRARTSTESGADSREGHSVRRGGFWPLVSRNRTISNLRC